MIQDRDLKRKSSYYSTDTWVTRALTYNS